MMDCFYGSQSSQSFVTILHQMCDSEFLKLTRSTVPSLHYWREPQSSLAHLLEAIGLGADAEGTLCFEYPVPSVGRNKPSFSDLMYISMHGSIAFEAKSTEPLGETCQQWLEKKNHSANAISVLQHWLALIERVTGRASADEVHDLPYQMIHRLASLCSVDSSRRILIYQHHRVDLKAVDFSVPLSKLVHALAAQRRIKIWLHLIDLERTDTYLEVEKSLAHLSPNEIAMRVRRAILDGRLFQVKRETFRAIC
jgi:hypothetical protein